MTEVPRCTQSRRRGPKGCQNIHFVILWNFCWYNCWLQPLFWIFLLLGPKDSQGFLRGPKDTRLHFKSYDFLVNANLGSNHFFWRFSMPLIKPMYKQEGNSLSDRPRRAIFGLVLRINWLLNYKMVIFGATTTPNTTAQWRLCWRLCAVICSHLIILLFRVINKVVN